MKRALVLSGGSEKGAYQVGAVKYLIGELKNQYQILCGVSVGALNSSFLGMYPEGKEEESIEALLDVWNNISNKNIYKRWFPFGRFHALWKSSFYNSKPLQNFVKSKLDISLLKASGKEVYVGAVSLDTGHYTIFDQTNDNFINAVIASASFPVMLAPIFMNNQLWTDGGIKELTPLTKAISLGATDIDVIMTSPSLPIGKFIKNPNSFSIIKRTIDLMIDEINYNDLYKAQLWNKLIESGYQTDKKIINFRIIRPNHSLVEDTLNFDKDLIQELIVKGYNDAKTIL